MNVKDIMLSEIITKRQISYASAYIRYVKYRNSQKQGGVVVTGMAGERATGEFCYVLFYSVLFQ